MKKLLLVFACLFFTFAWGVGPVPQPGQPVYYVATDGSNSNPGTEAEPWRTPLHAFRTAPGGSFVYIKEGEYNSHPYSAIEPRHPGSPEMWGVYRSYPGHKVAIYGQKARYALDIRPEILGGEKIYHHYYGLELRNYEKLGEGAGPVSHIVMENIEMHKGKTTGLRLENCSFMTFVNVYIHHNGQSGVSLRNCHDITFVDTESSYNDDGRTPDNSDADGFQTYGGYNLVFLNVKANFNAEDGFDLNADSLIVNSEARGNASTALKGWRRKQDGYEPKHITAIGNVFEGSGEAGIKMAQGASLSLYHNTIVRNGEGALVIKNHNRDGSFYRVKNNIMAFNGNEKPYGVGFDYGDSLDLGLLEESNNLYFENNNGNSDFVEDSPVFANPAFGVDYTLTADSPAIDAGALIPDLHSEPCNPDQGQYPYFGRAPDMGARESGIRMFGQSVRRIW